MSMDMDDNAAQANVAQPRQDPMKDGKESQSKQVWHFFGCVAYFHVQSHLAALTARYEEEN